MWKDAKYVVAYILPLSAFVAVVVGGPWSFMAFVVAFGIIPALEAILPPQPDNLPVAIEMHRGQRRFFDILLYLNLPIVFGLVILTVWRVTSGDLSTFEISGMILGTGIVVGSCGINVGHELGHRERVFDQIVAELLLIPAMYTHFTIEHNYGHHRNVATPEDPATARYGETVFAFWLRSILGTCTNAWRLQTGLLNAQKQSFFDLRRNSVLRGVVLQALYLALFSFFFGLTGMIIALATGIIGVLLLESVNYIEHYGLLRGRLESGRYEPVNPGHSWNSDHQLGRIFLYELTRHSDHHFKSTRKYQVLRHMNEAPQLPYGYPTSIILALIPPLWMRIVHKELNRVAQPASQSS